MMNPAPRSTEVCRDLQHSWNPHDGGRDGAGYFRVLLCARCGTTVRQQLDREGNIESRKYSYPQGYLVKGGAFTKQERAAIRLHNITKEHDNGTTHL